MRKNNTGILQVYYVDGKGKTSSAVGQAVRAAGNGFTVYFVQFIKSGRGSGEINVLENLPGIVYRVYGTGKFLEKSGIGEEDRKIVYSGMEFVRKTIDNKNADMLVLDEIGAVLELGIVSAEEILDLLNSGKGCLDIVLTGRSFPASVIKAADLVTRMEKVKHHYDRGAAARRGIEF